jgi:chaperonin GroEL
MPKMMLHRAEARAALGRGVAKLTLAVQGTLGPKGMNAIIDRPIGTPIVSRDGVSIADEVELPCRFENMGAQVVREVSKQTNEVAGDGTTTATVLANALIQDGLKVLESDTSPVDLVAGIDRAAGVIAEALRRSARPLSGQAQLEAVATIAATDPALGRLVAEALGRVGADGIVEVQFGPGITTTLEVVEGMSFDRGYISHHMVTDVETMRAVLDDPLILITDQRIASPAQIEHLLAEVSGTGRPLLIIADELAPDVVVSLLGMRRNGIGLAVAVNPPEFGHWRKAMLEDIAILTGGRVIARDLGGRLEQVTLGDLGGADRVEVGQSFTALIRGRGDPEMIRARRAQVQRQFDAAPPNIERDKYTERLAKLTGGTATILAGGATPAEQKRRVQLLDDSLSAARAAIEEGVVAGGGTALIQVAGELDKLADQTTGGVREGVRVLQRSLKAPLACIAENCGLKPADILAQVAQSPKGTGFDARTCEFTDLIAAGVTDPVKVTMAAVRNAASAACLILNTHTLIADKPEFEDPTAGPALGAGAEKLGRQ